MHQTYAHVNLTQKKNNEKEEKKKKLRDKKRAN